MKRIVLCISGALWLFGCGPAGEVLSSIDAGANVTTAGPGDPCSPGLPVKLLFLVENSGKTCVLDPPGTTGGFCSQVAPAGVTTPGRVKLLQAFWQQFADTSMPNPNTGVALSVFNTKVTATPFVPQTAPQSEPIPDAIAALPSTVGGMADFQGALEDAVARVEADIQAMPVELRAQQRYMVLLLSSGLPTPRCAKDDALSEYATALTPELTWADFDTFPCNTADPTDPSGIPGFTGGEDRNQNAQLFAAVDKLAGLKDIYGVADIRLHTEQLFDEANLTACGAFCSDLYPLPGASPSGYPVALHAVGRWLLQRLAEHGHGSFTDPINPQAAATTSIGGAGCSR